MISFYILVNAAMLWLAFHNVRQVGLRQVIPFGVCLALLLVYCLITPGYFYLTDRETVTGDVGVFRQVGKSILEYYEEGMLAYTIANGFFILGFVWFSRKGNEHATDIRLETLPALRKTTLILYGLFMLIVLADIGLTGINPVDVLLHKTEDTLFSAQTALGSYYFRAFADSIIVTIVLYAYLHGSRLRLFVILVPTFALFALLGFRYRMILTIMGLLLVYFLDKRVRLNWLQLSMLAIGLAYFVFTITHNRWVFLRGDLTDLSVNPTEYDYSIFYEQTRGSLADFNLLRYYDENPGATHDYGLSMFGYVFVRAIPKQFFPGEEKPYPSPYIDTLDKSLELPGNWVRIGEASLHYGAFFAAFGWAGFIIMPLLMGLWLRIFINRNPASQPIGFIKQIAFSLALFQLITRGYFPQFVDHYVYFFIPIWIMGSRIRQATASISSAADVHESVY